MTELRTKFCVRVCVCARARARYKPPLENADDIRPHIIAPSMNFRDSTLMMMMMMMIMVMMMMIIIIIIINRVKIK